MTKNVRPSAELSSVLAAAAKHGYRVEQVRVGDIALVLSPLDANPPTFHPPERKPGEDAEAYTKRSVEEIRKASEREAKIARYAKELGAGRARALVDSLP